MNQGNPSVAVVCASCGEASHHAWATLSAGSARCRRCGRGVPQPLGRPGLGLDALQALSARQPAAPAPLHSEHTSPPNRRPHTR